MEERKDFILQIGQLNKKIDNARELTLNDDISSADYRLIKEQCDESITCREARLNELNTQNSVVLDIKTIVQEAVDSLLSLDKLYENATVAGKRYLVGMLYPQKLTYAKGGCRTQDMNKATEMIYLKNKVLRAKKMGQKSVLKTLPHEGWKDFQISSRFIADLKRLADLPRKMKEVEGWLKGG